jgi:hypothetical protein
VKQRSTAVCSTVTSQKAFGDYLDLDMFLEFFEGLSPLVMQVRNEKMAKYTRTSTRVMK